jgi:hypothetical protein
MRSFDEGQTMGESIRRTRRVHQLTSNIVVYMPERLPQDVGQIYKPQDRKMPNMPSTLSTHCVGPKITKMSMI